MLDSPERQIAREEDARSRFVRERLGRDPEPLEAMDLTRFMHGGRGRLLRCTVCGTLLRDEPARGGYTEDIYDPALMAHLYPRYRRAFAEKAAGYRPLLREGAEVVELGSHLGAFLETAEKWKWRPVGLDIGRATSDFARSRGLAVKRLALADYAPRLRRPEAVFIWNCFEQLENPGEILRTAHRLLDRHGLVVLRVPNADFYRHRRALLGESRQALRLLGYNNLLGFPYLHGYTEGALGRLLSPNGFEPINWLGSRLLTPPYADMTDSISREWDAARRHDGPWIEVVSRRIDGGSRIRRG